MKLNKLTSIKDRLNEAIKVKQFELNEDFFNATHALSNRNTLAKVH